MIGVLGGGANDWVDRTGYTAAPGFGVHTEKVRCSTSGCRSPGGVSRIADTVTLGEQNPSLMYSKVKYAWPASARVTVRTDSLTRLGALNDNGAPEAPRKLRVGQPRRVHRGPWLSNRTSRYT